ncbi:LutC/YkgG family protein [Bacillus chungangensis]|uniref:Lactate utilization protein C n=1 Tax=Bacillus chungangensis TaxID=587633 RepID=A0ABT9WND3_9BACI|nr:lactate utilization protein C [Bacillus chungangensis]MDQ0174706.1 L-lactate dehydrogenase complex protein LldG [Bacillus chungangensis]
MMKGNIYHRERFLEKIAKNLGRGVQTEVNPNPQWQHQPQWKGWQGLTQDELLVILKEQCVHIHTKLVETKQSSLTETLKAVVSNHGGGPVIAWKDDRFAQFGLSDLLCHQWPKEGVPVHIWSPEAGENNITLAEEANVGITFSDQTLAESGTVVLFSSSGKGRSVSLLPKTYIAIIPKSTIVPRITQAATSIHQRIKNGEKLASCINFISGPSNSADIEMNLVVGVHGPMKATYIVVEDQ